MMPSYHTSSNLEELKTLKYPIIDLRSDTKSLPTKAMREAMFSAEVGDDICQEDPTCNKLEKKVAELFKKEAAIFITSGTMGNIMAIMAHCDQRGQELICGDQSHIYHYEQGGPAQLGGVHTRTVKNLEDGTFDLKEAEEAIRIDNIHFPITGLIVVENTHNLCGGRVLPMTWLKKLGELSKKHNVPVHMDGARIFNAAVKLGLHVSEIVQYVDSVQFCFSKGLGAPVGSMLVGSAQLIAKARRLRKVLGAAMRQAGVIAAPCLVALDQMVDRLADDHRRAQVLALGIQECGGNFFTVDAESVETNILMIKVNNTYITAPDFCSRLCEIGENEKLAFKEPCIVMASPKNVHVVRLVVYHNITDQDITNTLNKLRVYVEELKQSFKTEKN